MRLQTVSARKLKIINNDVFPRGKSSHEIHMELYLTLTSAVAFVIYPKITTVGVN